MPITLLIVLGSSIEQTSASNFGAPFAGCDAELLGAAVVPVVPDDELTGVEVDEDDFAALCELFLQALKLTTLAAATTSTIAFCIEHPRAAQRRRK